jgi:hypothetical protein
MSNQNGTLDRGSMPNRQQRHISTLLEHLLIGILERNDGELSGRPHLVVWDVISLLRDPETYGLGAEERMVFNLFCWPHSVPELRGPQLEVQAAYPFLHIFLSDTERGLPSRLLVTAKVGNGQGEIENFEATEGGILDLLNFSRAVDIHGCSVVVL